MQYGRGGFAPLSQRRRLAQSLAGKLFCKNRFFDCPYSTFVCVGICFAKNRFFDCPYSTFVCVGICFAKNRFFDYARSILVCVGVCFAKTGVSIAGALFSHVCSCLHDTRQVPTFRRRIGVSRAGTRSGIAIAHAGWCPGTPRNKKTELWFGTANWRGGFCHTPPRPQRGTSPSPREVFDRATFSHSAIDHRSTIRHVSPVESRHRGGLKGTSRIGVRDMLSYQRPAARLAGGETQRYLLQSWPSAAWS